MIIRTIHGYDFFEVSSAIDKRAFLSEVIAEVGEDSALLVLHVA